MEGEAGDKALRKSTPDDVPSLSIHVGEEIPVAAASVKAVGVFEAAGVARLPARGTAPDISLVGLLYGILK